MYLPLPPPPPGPFHVFNCANEAACLRKWFDHMREVREEGGWVRLSLLCRTSSPQGVAI